MNEKKFEYRAEDINLGELSKFQVQVIEKDLRKTGLQELINLKFDYLIIDNHFEVKFGICKVGDRVITNNIWNIRKTPFFENLEETEFLTMQKNTEEYFDLWCKSCDSFFEFLKEYKPDVKVILNPVRGSTLFIEKDKSICEVDPKTYEILINENRLTSLLDNYILENYDVDVIIFDKLYLADKNHPWNFSYVHYEPEYYKDFTRKLDSVIERDNELDYDSDDSRNIRRTLRTSFLGKEEKFE